MRLPLTVSAFALLVVIALGAGPAAAQIDVPGCPPRLPVAEAVAAAPVVFVGTVAAVADGDRAATIEVTKVWKGGPLPRTLQVRGNLATQSKVTTAIDRTYRQGARYLFVPSAGASPSFKETICSPTAALTNELVALAPPGGGTDPTGPAPVVERDEGSDTPAFLPLAIAGVAFVALAGALAVGIRKARRRPTYNP